MICEYGCNQEANYELKNKRKCCQPSFSKCPSVRDKNSKGVAQAHKDGKMCSKFPDGSHKNSRESMFVNNINKRFTENSIASNAFIKRAILEHYHVTAQCNICKLTEWYGNSIPLELHHINGINTDNRIENLVLLCLNCHSYTENFRGRNANSGVKKVSDEQMINAFKQCGNTRKALLSLGLAAKGGNYTRMNKLVKK